MHAPARVLAIPGVNLFTLGKEEDRGRKSRTPQGFKSPEYASAGYQFLGVILPVKDWTTILPSFTTNVSVPISYVFSAVSAVQTI